jgi:hypothetical protein
MSRVSFQYSPQLPPLNVNPANYSSQVKDAAEECPAHQIIAIRNRRYSLVLSISTYRLRDRTSALLPYQASNLTSAANQIRSRLEGCFFTGDPSLSVLHFFHQLVRVSDQLHMSEATLIGSPRIFFDHPSRRPSDPRI